MSIDINWDTLTSGVQGQELADTIRDFIHNKFQQVQLPRFIRSVEVHSFSFGPECPNIDIIDIADPHPDFYEDDTSSSSQDDSPTQPGPMPPPPLPAQPSSSLPSQQFPPNPTTIATHFPHLQQPPTSGQASPIRTGTPGIPGGTSNLSYFHLPLRQGLGSGTATPAPFTPTFPWPNNADYHHHNRPPTPPAQTPWSDPSSPPPRSRIVSPGISQPLIDKTANAAFEEKGAPNPLDLQLTLHISYTGSLSLSLTAEILLDYPMPSFVCLPLRLTVTDVSFDGVGLLAYINPAPLTKTGDQKDIEEAQDMHDEEEEGGRRIVFCFLPPEEGRLALSSTNTDSDERNKRSGGERGKGSADPASLIQHIAIESEIGNVQPVSASGSEQRNVSEQQRSGGGEQGVGGGNEQRSGGGGGEQRSGGAGEQKQPPLKNVGKVERFVVEQVRRIFEGELVWPGWWTFLV